MLRRQDVGALITAAGRSSRMGQVKAMLPWGDTAATSVPLVRHQCDALTELADVVVVTGCHADTIEQVELPTNARTVRNDAWDDGRSTSVAAGARALLHQQQAGGYELAAVVVVAVDQPLESTTIDRLLAAFEPARGGLLQPGWRDLHGRPRRGHPLVFDAQWLSALCGADRLEHGLRTLVEQVQPRVVAEGVATGGLDLNTFEAYQQALEQWRRR